ncbi:SET domain-containing protein [bacterium]|nr:MAG: SET domain-containing protein [bacterium]
MKLFPKITLAIFLAISSFLVISLFKVYPQEQPAMEWSEFSFILKPSSLGGVGVFAMHDIPAGTPLFRTDHRSRTFKTKDLDPEFIKYCVLVNDEECRGPERFDRLEISWYLNHSHMPNIAKYDKPTDRGCYALKDIKAGDEILIDYSGLNEPEHLKEDYYKQSTTTTSTSTLNPPNQQAQKNVSKTWSEFSFMLKPSSLGGIGVFAVHDIPTGTQVFRNDHIIKTWKVKDLSLELRQYCIYLNDEECLGPERFDRMEIGWYLNHSDTPNIAKNHEEMSTIHDIRARTERAFVTTKDIKAGDEILIDYNYLNEPEHLKEDYYKKSS